MRRWKVALPTETTSFSAAIEPEPNATAFVTVMRVSALDPKAKEAAPRAFAPKPKATAFKASKSLPNVIASPPASAPAPNAKEPDENALAFAPKAAELACWAAA